MILAGLAAGKHVFCETGEHEQQRTGGYHRAADPSYVSARRLSEPAQPHQPAHSRALDEGELGKMLSIKRC